MLQRPETWYTKTRDGHVAFQVFGEGDVDVLLITSWLSNIDVMWDDPRTLDYFDRLSRFARVALFDKRGTGVSDPIAPDSLPTLEEWMDDAIAVLDAAGLESAAVIADGEGGPMALMLAATYPERVSGVVLVNTYARFARSDDYPIGMPTQARRELALQWEQNWGRTAEILGYHGSVARPRHRIPRVVRSLSATGDRSDDRHQVLRVGDAARYGGACSHRCTLRHS